MSPRTSKQQKRSALSIVASWVVHATSIMVLYTLSFWPMGSDGLRLLGEASESQNFGRELALQLGLSAAVWGLMYTALVVASSRRPPRRVKLQRGSIVTETLIVVPVFLFLTLGLVQLTLNNTAAILTGLAAFESGRTVHLWAPETGESARNGGATKAELTERTRVAAATVLAPMHPASFYDGCQTTKLFDAKVEAMMAVSLGAAGDIGTSSVQTARQLALTKEKSTANNLSLAKAFDSEAFEVRAPLKFLGAYCHTQVQTKEVEELQSANGSGHVVIVNFDFKQVVPLVGVVFGRKVEETGRYAPIARAYEVPAQIAPNPLTPTSVLAFVPGQLGNPFSGWF